MNRICQIEIDEKGLARPTPEIEQERRVAIFDLLEENSFTPARRLTQLSAMSPICPAKATSAETGIRTQLASERMTKPAPTNAAPIHPAIVPDQVFFGLTLGQNFGPPSMRPAK